MRRWIAGVTAPQALMGAYQHAAHMAIVNVTFVGFAGAAAHACAGCCSWLCCTAHTASLTGASVNAHMKHAHTRIKCCCSIRVTICC